MVLTMKKLFYTLLIVGVSVLFLLFHSDMRGTSRKKIITLMIWHTYVEQMGDSFDVLVQEFNDTAGAKEGIVVRVRLMQFHHL